MDKELRLFLRYHGHNPDEDRFGKCFKLWDLMTIRRFEWVDQKEGLKYWYDLLDEKNYENLKIIKNNKLNKKLYPEYTEIEGYLVYG